MRPSSRLAARLSICNRPVTPATRARSKSKQLERLEVIEIAGDEPPANIRAPQVEPRKGPALRCRGLAIGYPERAIAAQMVGNQRPKAKTADGQPAPTVHGVNSSQHEQAGRSRDEQVDHADAGTPPAREV